MLYTVYSLNIFDMGLLTLPSNQDISKKPDRLEKNCKSREIKGNENNHKSYHQSNGEEKEDVCNFSPRVYR